MTRNSRSTGLIVSIAATTVAAVVLFALYWWIFVDPGDGDDAVDEPTTTTVPDRQFDNSTRIGENDRVLRAALEALQGVDAEDDDWYVGVILEEYETSLRVAARNGSELAVVVVESGDQCYRERQFDLSVLVSPGDIITWSPTGEDQLVCEGELEVLQIGAVDVD